MSVVWSLEKRYFMVVFWYSFDKVNYKNFVTQNHFSYYFEKFKTKAITILNPINRNQIPKFLNSTCSFLFISSIEDATGLVTWRTMNVSH